MFKGDKAAIEHVKLIVRLSLKDKECLDKIMKNIKIPPAKAGITSLFMGFEDSKSLLEVVRAIGLPEEKEELIISMYSVLKGETNKVKDMAIGLLNLSNKDEKEKKAIDFIDIISSMINADSISIENGL